MIARRYADVREQLATGDVLLFNGRGLFSDGIKVATHSPWSHCAMVVRDAVNDLVLCWESTTLANLPDVASGQLVKGVQLVNLSLRLETYPGSVAWRRLVGPRDATILDGFCAARVEFAARPYEERLLDLAVAELDLSLLHTRHDLASLFCSELLGATYQAMLLLPDTVNPGDLVPRDWAESGRGHKHWIDPWVPAPYFFEPEVLLTLR